MHWLSLCAQAPWMILLLAIIQDASAYDETLKERIYDESDSRIPW
jgi:hypothetical protein